MTPEWVIRASELTPRGALTTRQAELIGHRLREEGGLAVLPSDGCYSVAVVPGRGIGYTLINQALDRTPEPISLSFDTSQRVRWWVEAYDIVQRLLDHLTPGPLTVVCAARASIADRLLQEGLGVSDRTLGVRIPDSAIEQKVVGVARAPITTIAVRRSSGEIVTDFQEAWDRVTRGLARLPTRPPLVAVEGRAPFTRTHSTVVRVSMDPSAPLTLIRAGGLDFSRIIEAAARPATTQMGSTRDRLEVDAHETIVRAAVDLGLARPEQRHVLLRGIPAEVVADLTVVSQPANQLRADLLHLDDPALPRGPAGRSPIQLWLRNAWSLSAQRDEGDVFRHYLALLAGPLESPPELPMRPGPAPAPSPTVDGSLQLQLDAVDAEIAEAGGRSTSEQRAARRRLRARMTHVEPLAAGEVLAGRYRLFERLGSGGFATVWKALDQRSRRTLALKILHAESGGRRAERFRRGARTMAALAEHPNVVDVYEVDGQHAGRLFITMALCATDLARALEAGAVHREDTPGIITAIASALQAAHDRGFVHRDVKPSNILLTAEGRPKLADFDLVRAEDSPTTTRTGALGAFAYTAPECVGDPAAASGASDQFSLAMTALSLMYGARLPGLAYRRPERFLARLAAPEAVQATLLRALEDDPQDRFDRVDAFAKAFAKAWGEAAPPR